MDIEKLTKAQIVLLTLLVSFVTSIATGIVTVSLMDQAPPAMTQTINRVVERTVERVVPSETQAATVVTQERTVVVKESDLIADAITRITPSVVRIYRTGEEGETLVAIGTALSDRDLVTDAGAIVADASYVGVLSDGTRVGLGVVGTSGPVALLRPRAGEEEEEPPALTGATVNSDAISLGQTIVAIIGESETRIADGIVTATASSPSESEAATSSEATSSDTQPFTANISAATLLPGSTAINIDGAVIGMYHRESDTFLPSSVLHATVSSVEESAAGSEDDA